MTDFSYQLYSSRNFPPLTDTLHMLAKLGYVQVEGYGALYEDPKNVTELIAALAQTGLSMPTAHMGLDALRDAPDRCIEIAKSLGIGTIFVPYLDASLRPTDAAGWAAFGTSVAEAGKPIWDAGLKLGWHNHDFEMADLGGADRPLDLIMAADDRLVLELDVAWVQVGGQDPLAWITKYADRLDSIHIKDIAPKGDCVDEDGWADVGHGVMDWAALMGAAEQTSARYFIMEHDNPSDHARFAQRSLATVQNF